MHSAKHCWPERVPRRPATTCRPWIRMVRPACRCATSMSMSMSMSHQAAGHSLRHPFVGQATSSNQIACSRSACGVRRAPESAPGRRYHHPRCPRHNSPGDAVEPAATGLDCGTQRPAAGTARVTVLSRRRPRVSEVLDRSDGSVALALPGWRQGDTGGSR